MFGCTSLRSAWIKGLVHVFTHPLLSTEQITATEWREMVSQWNVNGKTSITDGGPTLPSSVLQNRHLSESCFTSQDNPLLYSILKDTVHVCLCIQYIYIFY